MLRKYCPSLAWAPPASSLKPVLACSAFILMAVYLWFLPIGHTIAIRNLAFFSLIFLTFWAAWRQGLRLHLPLAWAWLPYVLVSLISVSYALNPDYSLGEVKKEVGYALLALLIAASWVRNSESLSRLVQLLVVGDILMVGAALVKGIAINPFWNDTFPQVDSLYNGVGNFSTYLITVMPFIAAFAYQLPKAKRVQHLLLFSLLACNIFALYLTSNRMGMLTLIAEILFIAGFLYFKSNRRTDRKKLIVASAIILALAWISTAMINNRPAGNDARWELWQVALNNIHAQPLSGGGFGREAFTLRNLEFRVTHGQLWHAHNMFLNKGVQMGIPGMLAFVLLLFAACRAMWPARALAEQDRAAWAYALAGSAMLVGVILKNMTDDFFVNDNAFLFWVLTGAVIGGLPELRNKASLSKQPT